MLDGGNLIDYPKLFPQNLPTNMELNEIWGYKGGKFQIKINKITNDRAHGIVLKAHAEATYAVGQEFDRSFSSFLEFDFKSDWHRMVPAKIEAGQIWKSNYRTFKIISEIFYKSKWKTVNLVNDCLYKIGYVSENENDIRDLFYKDNSVYSLLSLDELKNYRCQNCLCINNSSIVSSFWKCKRCKYFWSELI